LQTKGPPFEKHKSPSFKSIESDPKSGGLVGPETEGFFREGRRNFFLVPPWQKVSTRDIRAFMQEFKAVKALSSLGVRFFCFVVGPLSFEVKENRKKLFETPIVSS